jgi:hypothetical protein
MENPITSFRNLNCLNGGFYGNCGWMKNLVIHIKERIQVYELSKIMMLRGASHYCRWVERTLDKFPLGGQCRNPLKSIIEFIYLSLERRVCPLKES